jgi:hypothetical protein
MNIQNASTIVSLMRGAPTRRSVGGGGSPEGVAVLHVRRVPRPLVSRPERLGVQPLKVLVLDPLAQREPF